MNQGPLSADELDWLDEVLSKYGHGDSVLDTSELDGMLTALLSGPGKPGPEFWLPQIWGGAEHLPEWESEQEMMQFHQLLSRHLNDIVDRLSEYPDQFEPLFGTIDADGDLLTVADDWCYGYMKGANLDDWSSLPPALQPALAAIALHGSEEQLSRLESLSPEAFAASIEAIRPAALSLYAPWPQH